MHSWVTVLVIVHRNKVDTYIIITVTDTKTYKSINNLSLMQNEKEITENNVLRVKEGREVKIN